MFQHDPPDPFLVDVAFQSTKLNNLKADTNNIVNSKHVESYMSQLQNYIEGNDNFEDYLTSDLNDIDNSNSNYNKLFNDEEMSHQSNSTIDTEKSMSLSQIANLPLKNNKYN